MSSDNKVLKSSDGKVLMSPGCSVITEMHCDAHAEGYGEISGPGCGFLPIVGPGGCHYLHAGTHRSWDGTYCLPIEPVTDSPAIKVTYLQLYETRLGGREFCGGSACNNDFYNNTYCYCGTECLLDWSLNVIDPVTCSDSGSGGESDPDCFCGGDSDITLSVPGADYETLDYDDIYDDSCEGYGIVDWPDTPDCPGEVHLRSFKFKVIFDQPLGCNGTMHWRYNFQKQTTGVVTHTDESATVSSGSTEFIHEVPAPSVDSGDSNTWGYTSVDMVSFDCACV